MPSFPRILSCLAGQAALPPPRWPGFVGAWRGVMVPNKMYVNRGRANGQFHPAAIEVRDLVWSSATLLETVERDLAQRRARAQALSNTNR